MFFFKEGNYILSNYSKSNTHGFICKFCAHATLCIFRFHMYLCFLLLSMTLFMCHFVPTNDVVKTVCLSASASSFFHLSTCFF